MKKYKSLSAAILAFSFETTQKQNTAPEGQPAKLEDVKVVKEVCMSQGTEMDLPEDHPQVKDFIARGLIAEVVVKETGKKKVTRGLTSCSN